MNEKKELQRELEEAKATISTLKEELERTQKGLKVLSLELEQRVEERTSELNETKKELENHLTRYKQLFHGTGDAIYVHDKDGNIMDVNDEALSKLGYSKEELLSMNLSDIRVSGTEVPIPYPEDGRVGFETVHVTKGGSNIPVDVNATRIKYDGRKAVLNVARDIRKRKKAEAKRKHLNSVLRSVRNVNQLLVRAEEQTDLIDGICSNLIETRGFNHVWVALVDDSDQFYAFAQAGLGDSFAVFKERLRSNSVPDRISKALTQREVLSTEDHHVLCKDCALNNRCQSGRTITARLEYGDGIYGLISASVPEKLLVKEEELSLLKEMAGDIAFGLQNMEVEEQLRRREKQLRRSQEVAKVGSWEIDLETGELKWSEAVYDIFGAPYGKSISYKDFLQLVHPDDRDFVDEEWNRALKGKNYDIEHRIVVEGETKWVREKARIKFDGEGEPREVIGSVQDITGKKLAEENLKESKERLRESFVQLAETTSRVLGVRDPYTQKHELRVGDLAREVGKRMGLEEEKRLGLYLGGVLHDIGKIAVPETILTKPGELKEVEWRMIKSHPEVGYEKILKDTDFPWPVAEMTLHHHERLDGSGYPDGLKGNELTTEVRILGACDVVEAMSSRRPYREVRSKEETLAEIESGKRDKYDTEVVDILVEMIEAGDVRFGKKS